MPMGVLYQLREVLKYGTFLEQMTNPTALPWGRNRVSGVRIQRLTAWAVVRPTERQVDFMHT